MSRNDSDKVYSTGSEESCPECWMPPADCICTPAQVGVSPGAGVTGQERGGAVRVRREVKGRRGKTVTVIFDLKLDAQKKQDLASELKQRCGCGGSVKDGLILIQGDRVQQVLEILKSKGFVVKRSGG